MRGLRAPVGQGGLAALGRSFRVAGPARVCGSGVFCLCVLVVAAGLVFCFVIVDRSGPGRLVVAARRAACASGARIIV